MCRKRRYRTKDAAERIARLMTQEGKAAPGALNTYWCERCRAWHVGHRPNAERIGPAVWAAIGAKD